MSGSGLISGLDAFGANSDEIDFITPKPVGLFNPRKRVMLLECWSREPQRRPASDDGLKRPGDVQDARVDHDRARHADRGGARSITISSRSSRSGPTSTAERACRTARPTMLGPQEALNHP